MQTRQIGHQLLIKLTTEKVLVRFQLGFYFLDDPLMKALYTYLFYKHLVSGLSPQSCLYF